LLALCQVLCYAGFSYAEYGVFDPAVYEMYIGIALMMLVGFGYLMTFLKAYGLGAVGFTFIITALAVQMNVLLAAYIPNRNTPVIDATTLTDGNFAAATVLISFGCVLGKTSPAQLILLTIIESIFFQINRNIICFEWLQIEDAGGTVVIHMFGAYFGLAIARVLGQPKDPKELSGTSIVSNILSLVGTVFLWLYWPSFNGGAFTGDPVQAGTAIANTVLGLLASCVCTFIVSGICGGKFSPADVQNATLAGGVAVGAIARIPIGAGWASAVGSIGGIISALGYQFLQPFLERKIGLHDSCGVHNLHGMPGILGSVVAIIFTETHHQSWMPHAKGSMAGPQAAAFGITLVFALVAGAITGFILKFFKTTVKSLASAPKATNGLDNSVHFDDDNYWHVSQPEDASNHPTISATKGKVEV